MRMITVAPGLVLDDEMYDLAVEALGKYAPEQVAGFTWERFIARERWVLIPNQEQPDEPWFKAECIIKHGPPYEQTIKLNVWRAPDLQRDGAPMPHSHPWEQFTGHVLLGGYVENRYEGDTLHHLAADPHTQCSVGSVNVTSDVVHQAGDDNVINQTTFHAVTGVLEPGRTLSLMDCGLGRKEGWGYLDPNTGLYTPNKLSPSDPRFKALKLALNPHLQK